MRNTKQRPKNRQNNAGSKSGYQKSGGQKSGQGQASGNLKKFRIQEPVNRNDKIMSALDKLGLKFIEGEADRMTINTRLDENFNAQKEMDRKLKRHIVQSERLNSQLNASLQENERLRKKIEDGEKGRVRLQKRVERVELIAKDAQSALETKALVLLTDHAIAQQTGLPQISATGATGQEQLTLAQMRNQEIMESLELDGIDYDPGARQGHYAALGGGNRRWFGLNNSVAVIALIGTAVIGWAISSVMQPSPQQAAFAVLQDGQLARIDLQTGTISPVIADAQKIAAEQGEASTQNASAATEEEGFFARLFGDKPLPAPEKPERGEETAEDTAAVDNTAQSENAVSTTTSESAVEATTTETAQGATEAAQENSVATQPETETVLPLEERVVRDKKLSKKLKKLEDKAFKGDSEAQHDLAAIYTAGQGVKKDYAKAAVWFREAALSNVANASYNLGVLYHQGLGVEQDMIKALDWYRRAAMAGHPEAQYNLGIAYIEGMGAKYNPYLAAAFFQQSALNGVLEGAYNLGLILENGLLGQAHLEQAMVWYRAAADKGSEEAKGALSLIAEKLGVPVEKAGLLPNGKSMAKSMKVMDSLEPAFNGVQSMPDTKGIDMALASYIPQKDQIILAEIQGQLSRLSLYPGIQDGLIGPRTSEAIKTYQTIQGLKIDGKSSEALLAFMLMQATRDQIK